MIWLSPNIMPILEFYLPTKKIYVSNKRAKTWIVDK